MKIQEDVFSYPIDRTEGNYIGETLSIHIIETGDAVLQFGSGDKHTVSDVREHTADHDVDIVIVEHADPDHYGGAKALRTDLGVEVAIPELDAPTLEKLDIPVDHRLQPGEEFHGVDPIEAPGHSVGNMSYLYDDILVAGDTVIGSDFGRAADGDWSGPLAVLQPSSHEDVEEAHRSVERLLEYEFEKSLVTHGSNVLEDGTDAVRTLVENLKE